MREAVRPVQEVPRGVGAARIGLAGEEQRRSRCDLPAAREREDARLVHGDRDGGVHLPRGRREKREIAADRKPDGGDAGRLRPEPRRGGLNVAREAVRVTKKRGRDLQGRAGLLRRLAVSTQVEGERREAQRAELFGERLPLAPLAREVVDEEDARCLRVAFDRTERGREGDAVGRGNRDAVRVCGARDGGGLGLFFPFLCRLGGPAREKGERDDQGDRAPEGGPESRHFGLKPLPSANRTWSCT